MTASDFTVALFCRVDDLMLDEKKHPLASLHPSEVVTLGVLHTLRGGGCRAFYRWAKNELSALFPRLPERTRLFRLLQRHAALTQRFLAEPTVFGVCDAFGIELLHPMREGRSAQQIGRKGQSNHRWIVGAKWVVLCNSAGQIVDWRCDSANVCDIRFHDLIAPFEEKMIVLCDKGFKAAKSNPQGNPLNLKVCEKGKWNERMIIETLFSLLTTVCGLKKLSHRLWPALRARLAYTAAAYNLCTTWTGRPKMQLAPFKL
jgi:hypothetical protein